MQQRCLAAVVLLGVLAAAEKVDLHVEGGVVTGLIVQNHSTPVDRFLGIPFAEPPIGELRWTSPQKLKPFGKRSALRVSAQCMQSTGKNAANGVGKQLAMSEDW